MEELLKKMAGLLQDIYDEGHGGEFRSSIQEVLVKYNAAQQGVQRTGLESYSTDELAAALFSRRFKLVESPRH